MKRRVLIVAVVVAAFLASGASAQAQNVANFQGSTLAFSRNGDFNAQRGAGSSCAIGSTPSYLWTLVEDGVTRTGNPVTHRFTSPFAAYTVTLKITCADGTTATRTRFVCIGIGGTGCIFPDRGYN